jgi:hypothetical protein
MFSTTLWIAAEILACGFAINCGDRTLRWTGIWILGNSLFHTLLACGGVTSPTLHLINDGVYATGLLPLAFLTVSPWVGALALLACGAFIVQSVYLLSDRPTDWTFAVLNNVITVVALATLATGAAIAMLDRRRDRLEDAKDLTVT